MLSAPWGGLLAGIEARLSPDEETVLRDAFANYEAEHFGYSVLKAGEQIFGALNAETCCSAAVRDAYQDMLVSLLQAAQSSRSLPSSCCDYHHALFPAVSADIVAGKPTWLRTFFEILTALTEDLHFQFESPADASEQQSIELSRMMPLESFVSFHTNDDFTPATRDRFVQRLAPKYSRLARYNARQTGDLGSWRGMIGSYSGPTPATLPTIHPYARDCPSIKPFSTLTYEVVRKFDREDTPDRLLKALGVPFRPGTVYIELIYSSQHVRFHRLTDRHDYLAIPTCIEAAGNWAFRPDRDSPPVTNFALDLELDARGLPELVHQPITYAALEDAIVWPQPTGSSWADGSPLSTGPVP